MGALNATWHQGGQRGLDRPLDRAFVAMQRLRGKGWRTVTDDLGLEILWRVDDDGRYSAGWQVPPAPGSRPAAHRIDTAI